MTLICCRPKSLPPRLWIDAARTAVEHNPANRPGAGGAGLLPPLHIALLTSKYWGAKGVKLGVSFLDTTDAGLKAKILQHMNAWNQWGNVQFAESSQGEVRIARAADGYWSYLGTDILHIPAGQATMNLQDFSLNTPDSEYKRVVRHETGHTLGFPHEHMRAAIVARIDPAKAKAYFLANDGWDAQTVTDQVLTPLAESDLQATAPDTSSIMCYQLPGSIMIDGKDVPGGLDIDPVDGGFAGKIYPLAVTPPNPPGPGPGPTGPTAGPTLAAVEAADDAVSAKLQTAFAGVAQRVRGVAGALTAANADLKARHAALFAAPGAAPAADEKSEEVAAYAV